MSFFWKIAAVAAMALAFRLCSVGAENQPWPSHDSIVKAMMDKADTSLFWYSIDKKISCDSGSIFVVRMAAPFAAMDTLPLEEVHSDPEDTIYGLVAVADGPDGPRAWLCGGLASGIVSDRYYQAMSGDSLPTLFGRGAWWQSPDFWGYFRSEQSYQLAEDNYKAQLQLLDSVVKGTYGDSLPVHRVNQAVHSLETLTGITTVSPDTSGGIATLGAADIERWLEWWWANSDYARWDFEDKRIILDSLHSRVTADSTK